MIEIYNYDDWKEYSGASEGSGRSEKLWLINEKTNEKGVFKYPKRNKGDSIYQVHTSEFISERIAASIATRLGIGATRIEIGYRDGRIGCMSYLINKKNEYLIEGVELIAAVNPNFDPLTLYDKSLDEYYSFDMIQKAGAKAMPDNKMDFTLSIIVMMIFDMLIGNSDRHQSNWGIIGKTERRIEQLRFAPLYDNGSSLCAYIEELHVESYLGNDKVRFDSLIDSKSRSRIRIDGKTKKEPKHSNVIRFLYNKYPTTVAAMVNIIEQKITEEYVNGLLDEYPESILSRNKKKLIKKYLEAKIELLKQICEENRNERI